MTASLAPYRLITLLTSMNSELIRWILTYGAIPFQEQPHAPVFHALAFRRLGIKARYVALVSQDQRLADISAIIAFLKYQPTIEPLFSTSATEQAAVDDLWLQFHKELGGGAARWIYAHMLPQHQVMREIWTQGVPRHERIMYRYFYPQLSGMVKNALKINANTAVTMADRVRRVFDQTDKRLSDGRPYLLGECFSIIDMLFCANSAPCVLEPLYGVRLPTLEQSPPAMREMVEECRARPSGQFIHRIYEQHRSFQSDSAKPSGHVKENAMGFLQELEQAEPSQKKVVLKHWLGTKPLELFAELRQHRPIFSMPGDKGPVIVTRFRDVHEVLSDPTVFTVQGYARSMNPVVGNYMLAEDDTPLAEREKSLMRVMLCRDDEARVRALCGKLADDAIDASVAAGTLEVVSQLSRKVIAQMVEEYFGFPGPDRDTLLRWSRDTQHDMFYNLFDEDPHIHEASCQAGAQMQEHLKDVLIPQRRRELEQGLKGDNVLSRMLKTALPGGISFDEERIIANTIGLLVGAVETSSAAIVRVLDVLLSRPKQLAGAQQAARDDDDETLSQYVWEALRFSPQTPFLPRRCSKEYTVAAGSERATTIRAKSMVLVSTASAMHDDWELEHPEEFRLNRPVFHYLHMGYGHHRCLGYYLNLILVPEILKRLLRRPELRPADGDRGKIDWKQGPFPERFYVDFDTRRGCG